MPAFVLAGLLLAASTVHAKEVLDNLRGSWQVRSRIGPERWHFANDAHYSHGLHTIGYRYLSSNEGDPGRNYAFETTDVEDGARVFVMVRNVLVCEVYIVRNVHAKGLSGVLKMLDADCVTPLTTKVFRFHAKKHLGSPAPALYRRVLASACRPLNSVRFA